MRKNLKNKAFTLIELLVVIAIIGLLATIVTVSINSARTKARDARRKADLKAIQTALEMYYDQYYHYPIVNGWQYSTGAQPWIRCTTCSGAGETTASISQYLPQVPTDPKNNIYGPWYTGRYTYAYYSSTGQTYDLVGQLENTSDPDRCANKCWIYHTPLANRPWCSPCLNNYGYSPYMYADH